jgi:hypothetical protein
VIVDSVTKPRQGLFEVFLQGEARMIGAYSDSHGEQLYCTLCISSSQLSAVSPQPFGFQRAG